MTNFKSDGASLAANGYAIVAIKPRIKYPDYPSWQKNAATTPQAVAELAAQHPDNSGVGIMLTEKVCAIDVDIDDAEVSNKIHAWLNENIQPEFMYRVGREPRFLVPCRAVNINRKHIKNTPFGKIEILSKGQQFVAYNTHADTGKPYQWFNGEPINTAAWQLPIFSAEDMEALFSFLDTLSSEDDPFDFDLKEKVKIDWRLVEKYVMSLPEEYYSERPNWIRIGMAIHHQSDGSRKGFELWDKFSQQCLDKYDSGQTLYQWKSFKEDRGGEPITFATVLDICRRLEDGNNEKLFNHLRDGIESAATQIDCERACKEVSHHNVSPITLDVLVELAKRKMSLLTKTSHSTASLRAIMKYALDYTRMPEWLNNWVVLTADDCFYNLETHQRASEWAFNASMARFARAEMAATKKKPSDLAKEVYCIPVLASTEYRPNAERVFVNDVGLEMANEYNLRTVPPMPDEFSESDLMAITTFKQQVRNLVPDDEQYEILMQWFAHQVQNTGKLVGWAVVIQGTQGDGKSSLGEILMAAMGDRNVGVVNNTLLQNGYNDWATGYALNVVEEVDMSGSNRFVKANALKEMITNRRISVNQKYRSAVTVRNCCNYIFFTNSKEAIAIETNDRRYFVLFSPIQTKEALDEQIANNRQHYANLREVTDNPDKYGGALRKFLMEYPITDTFRSYWNAPFTEAKREMMLEGMHDEARELYDVLNADSPKIGLSKELFSVTLFRQQVIGGDGNGNTWAKMLKREFKMQHLCRVVLADGVRHTVYSANPAKWFIVGTKRVDIDRVCSALEGEIWNEDNDKPKFTRNIDDL